MNRKKTVTTRDDLLITKSDFVFEHHGKSFYDVYKTDCELLGEGKFKIFLNI